jgi:type VI secretion system protein ImpF
MIQQRAQDRLQPALLDRLTDEQPDQTRESAELQVISKTRMREAVLRDLSWLFNATQMDTHGELEGYERVRRSVLNYGMPVLSGQTLSSIEPEQMETLVRQAIVDHEPRILAHTLVVQALMSEEQLLHHNQISFRITGQIWAQPVPLELLLQTHVDLETGRVEVQELSR